MQGELLSLKATAKETLTILKNGEYRNASATTVRFLSEQKAAVAATRLYLPQQLARMLASPTRDQRDDSDAGGRMTIEVTHETTQAAAHRLVQQEGCRNLVLLNYASARRPGGGFTKGAKAQEEDLARCSGLYPCLLSQPDYYRANRAQKSLLYTDHLLYSPQVPFFRTENQTVLPEVFLASIITAPAPNAGEVLRREPEAGALLEETLRTRAGMVLTVAREHAHEVVLLGAWGCGVFRNDPHMVATVFADWLARAEFRHCFRRVVFAIRDSRRDQSVLKAFVSRFS